MGENRLMTLITSKLFREILLGILFLLVIVIYYFRYVHIAKNTRGRAQRRKLAGAIGSTRVWMILIVLAFAGVMVYDRVWEPAHATIRSAAVSSSKAKSSKKAAAKSSIDSSSASSSSTSSATIPSVTVTAAGTKAITIVSGYIGSAIDNQPVTFHFLGQITGNAGLPVQRVGAFAKDNTQLAEYWVYPSGQFDDKADVAGQ